MQNSNLKFNYILEVFPLFFSISFLEVLSPQSENAFHYYVTHELRAFWVVSWDWAGSLALCARRAGLKSLDLQAVLFKGATHNTGWTRGYGPA